MKLRDEETWKKGLANNQDAYGKGVYVFAEKWADLMESKIPEAATSAEVTRFLVDNASKLSHEADTEGITGFMYGCAVSTLSHVWIYGEELRRWHNLDTQIGNEGEKANESGGVLNPALLNIAAK